MDVSSNSSSNKNAVQEIARPLANFHPTVWGEFFIHLLASEKLIDHAQMQQRVELLMEEVRTMFSISTVDDGYQAVKEEMTLVDAVQRLGLAYHFEMEINKALARFHASEMMASSEDLHVVSLRFRLLRQGGYNISSNVFNKFKDVHGHFQGNLSFDIKGLLSLYEASYVGTQEDDILEEAMSFSRRELESMLDHLQTPLATEVVRALDLPLVRRLPRLEARAYISFYETMEGRNNVILELAKLDFNRVQALHQEEIRDLTRWWKELGLIEKLSFARDRLVEGYIWVQEVCYEPHLASVRMMTTKVICLTSVLDDIYDAYGTLDELRLLTDVIQRWDIGEREIPQYMKTYFMALSNTLKELEDQLFEEQKSDFVWYLKEEYKAIAKAYHTEAEWRDEGHTPTFKDHLQVSLISAGISLLICGFLLSMGDIATQDIFDWLASKPNIIEASAMITRLIDDIMSSEFDETRQHVVSTVQCYVKDYNVPKEMAKQKLREMANTAWKVMNEEWIKGTKIPLQILAIPIGLARLVEMYYKNYDGYTHSSRATKDAITLLLVNRIPL